MSQSTPTSTSERPQPKVVFISDRYDSDKHREWVLQFSERQWKDGSGKRRDQYVNGSSADGWPRWMLDRLDEAHSVLLVCMGTCYRRYFGNAMQLVVGTAIDPTHDITIFR